MKKICFIDYDMSVRGGVEQVTASLANALADTYEVHLISLCLTNITIPYELDERVITHALRLKDGRLRELKRELVPRLRRYLNENAIDVAIIQGNYPGFIASAARFKTKTKLVFCDHGALMNQWQDKSIVFIRLFASLLCHKVITLTEQSRGDYIKKFRLSPHKVGCIYNWIDLDKPVSSAYNAASKRIVSAGRFGKEKGFDMLVKAYAPLAKRFPEWHLDLFGDGEMMDTVCALVEEYDVGDNVHLLGMRSDLAERYKDYALYVLPSYREGMPLVLLEAKANRLPIVSFDIMTGPREIICDAVDGILVQPYDLEAMGEAIASLIDNEEKRVRMSERSQETLDKFSKETILKQWIKLIETL